MVGEVRSGLEVCDTRSKRDNRFSAQVAVMLGSVEKVCMRSMDTVLLSHSELKP